MDSQLLCLLSKARKEKKLECSRSPICILAAVERIYYVQYMLYINILTEYIQITYFVLKDNEPE